MSRETIEVASPLADAQAAGECSAFYHREILQLKSKLEADFDGFPAPVHLHDEDIEILCRKAWEAGREYGRTVG